MFSLIYVTLSVSLFVCCTPTILCIGELSYTRSCCCGSIFILIHFFYVCERVCIWTHTFTPTLSDNPLLQSSTSFPFPSPSSGPYSISQSHSTHLILYVLPLSSPSSGPYVTLSLSHSVLFQLYSSLTSPLPPFPLVRPLRYSITQS